MKKLRILFLCTGNSCRSQMAEAWARELKGSSIKAHSAGTHPDPRGVDPIALRVMDEVGIDMQPYTSKSLQDLQAICPVAFDYVVTVCEAASRACPIFAASGKTRVISSWF